MIKISTCVVVSAFVLSSCSSHLAVLNKDKYDTSVALDEMRIELSDVKHSLSNTQVEMQILEDKLRSQDKNLQVSKSQNNNLAIGAEQKIALMEKKLQSIEKMQEKLSVELKHLSTHANQTTVSLSQYQNRIRDLETELHDQNKLIHEIAQLKGTLKSITQAIKADVSPSTYRVKAGDSLEKIARMHKTTVDALKKANNLNSAKIVIGQEIVIPSGES
jgi:peptidoglycan endopeptidase LytE